MNSTVADTCSMGPDLCPAAAASGFTVPDGSSHEE